MPTPAPRRGRDFEFRLRFDGDLAALRDRVDAIVRSASPPPGMRVLATCVESERRSDALAVRAEVEPLETPGRSVGVDIRVRVDNCVPPMPGCIAVDMPIRPRPPISAKALDRAKSRLFPAPRASRRQLEPIAHWMADAVVAAAAPPPIAERPIDGTWLQAAGSAVEAMAAERGQEGLDTGEVIAAGLWAPEPIPVGEMIWRLETKLQASADNWHPVTRAGAHAVLTLALREGLVYRTTFMEAATAEALAERFLAAIPGDAALLAPVTAEDRARGSASRLRLLLAIGIAAILPDAGSMVIIAEDD